MSNAQDAVIREQDRLIVKLHRMLRVQKVTGEECNLMEWLHEENKRLDRVIERLNVDINSTAKMAILYEEGLLERINFLKKEREDCFLCIFRRNVRRLKRKILLKLTRK